MVYFNISSCCSGLFIFIYFFQENEFDEVVSLLNLLEIRSDTWQRALYESSSVSPPPPGQPLSAASSDLSARTDPENLSPACRFEAHPKKRRRRSSVPVNLSIDTTKHDEDTSVTQSNWRGSSKVSVLAAASGADLAGGPGDG